jgi:hypothetical protein
MALTLFCRRGTGTEENRARTEDIRARTEDILTVRRR